MTEFEQDCMRYHGKVLTGKYRHYCKEWDFLPIDESCQEIEFCVCDLPHLTEITPETINKIVSALNKAKE